LMLSALMARILPLQCGCARKEGWRRRGSCLRLPKRRYARLDPLKREPNRFVRYEATPGSQTFIRPPGRKAHTLRRLIVRAARRTPVPSDPETRAVPRSDQDAGILVTA
jgi:hypothetical protein